MFILGFDMDGCICTMNVKWMKQFKINFFEQK